VRKTAAALLLEPRNGQEVDEPNSGALDKVEWMRLLQPPAEGLVARGAQHLDVGDRVRVELIATNVERGFIDFARR